MIISRTPYRISFFGGGTDYPNWYLKNGGAVLSSSINKYCYLTIRHLPPFFEHRLRVVYSIIECCQHYKDIQHPAVRETLRYMNFTRNLEIHHDGDLPARSGMGSSSSFTVGLLHALYALKGIMASKDQLAKESIHIEQNMINETVGSQDQVAAAYGGLNHIIFNKDGEITVYPLTISTGRIEELNSHLMLFYTGIRRTASDIAKSYVDELENKEKLLNKMHHMVEKGANILQDNGSIDRFGDLLHDAWTAKRELSNTVSNRIVDNLYRRARESGALGGKISGAGGGGMLLLFVPPSDHRRVREALKELLLIPFRFEMKGSQIIFYDPSFEDFSDIEQDRSSRDLCSFRELDTALSETSH